MLRFTFSLWLVENARPSVIAFICNITEAKALKWLSDKEMAYLYGIAKAMNETVALRMDYIRTLKNNSLQTYKEILKLDVRVLHDASLKLHKRHRIMLRRALASSIESDKELKQLEDLSTYNDRTLSTGTHRTSKCPATDKAAINCGKNVDTIDQEMLIQKGAIQAGAVSAWGEIKVMIIMMHVGQQRYSVLREELVM
ncbi:hypothetical protein FAUST_2867 [Fusarium austroamericanum]|uniref:Uncharacterized protein n=1 Tax=Fusarium austroamericanum TaxID=282268 RepID=A0AAN6HIB3_FUSAU|nr:hypothetical protein FAUST_2867 [Fusarium austroamericanum]